MKITLRQYQKQASDAAVSFFKDSSSRGGLIIIPTGGGKSVLLADIAHRIGQPILIFCPSREIILQNYEKMEAIEKGISSMYSASVGQKKISMITFATIGSVKNHPHDFDVFRYVCIDEAHGVNAKGGMYEEFIHRRKDRKVLGVTATPYRLAQAYDGGSTLKFLTRTRPRIFDKVLYVCQVTDLLSQGYLADPVYYDVSEKTSFDITRVRTNSTGSDYDEESLKLELERSGFANDLFNWVMRVLSPKDGSRRNGILVFTRFVKESEQLVAKLSEKGVKAAIVTGETPKKERERIVNDFKKGEIQVVSNAACLSDDMEILTRNKGWIKREQLEPTDLIAQYDSENGEISFSRPSRIIDNDFSGRMVSIDGKYLKFDVTDNHDMLVAKRRRKGLSPLSKVKAETIVGKQLYFPVSGFAKEEHIVVEQKQMVTDSRFVSSNAYNYRKRGMSYEESISLARGMLELRNKRKFKSPHELSLDECRFIGFWLGDGNICKSRAGGLHCSLCQSDGTPKLQEWIEELLVRCGIHYSTCHRDGKDEEIRGKKVHTKGFKVYNLSWGTGGNKQNVQSSLYSLMPYLCKKGTELYWGFSREQFFALMEGLFKADGMHGDNLPYKGSRIIGEHKELFDLLQAIGVCRGYRMMIHEANIAATCKKRLYCISLCDTRFHQSVNETAQSRKVQDKHVWCVTMPKGNIVVRKNGRVIIIGNCLSVGFDYPELDTVVLARPTKSLALYYQQVGRCVRPCKGKKTWVVDLTSNIKRFGKVSDLKIGLEKPNSELWAVFSRGRKLTNTLIV